MPGGRTIAEQDERAPERNRQVFGRVDPFCAFVVLPTLVLATIFFWGGLPVVAVVLIVLSILVVVVDSWANRPVS